MSRLDEQQRRWVAGREAPYGVYDPERNEGHACVTKTGLKVSNAEFKSIQLISQDICPQRNYTIRPRPKNTA